MLKNNNYICLKKRIYFLMKLLIEKKKCFIYNGFIFVCWGLNECIYKYLLNIY